MKMSEMTIKMQDGSLVVRMNECGGDDGKTPEFVIELRNNDGNFVQDIALVRPCADSTKVETLVWANENDESYTHHFAISRNRDNTEHCADIRIPAAEIEKYNRLLALPAKDGIVEKNGYDPDDTIETYTAYFDNGYEADINICTSDVDFFIDSFLVNPNGAAECTLDVEGSIDGEYEFESDGDTYIVRVITI